MPPIPRTTVPQPVYASPPGTVALSCPDSQVGANPTYTWSLVAWPDGSSPSLTGASTANPQLTGASVRGTYVVFLSITDSTGSSHPVAYPTQAQVAPYGFTSPLASAFALVRVAEESGLVKPARGQYGWLEDLWDMVDAIGENGGSFEFYDPATKTLEASFLTAASGSPLTLSSAGNIIIDADDELRLSSPIVDGTLYADLISSNSAQPITISNASGYSSVAVGTDISISAADDITLSTTASNGDITISAEGGTVTALGNVIDIKDNTLKSSISVGSSGLNVGYSDVHTSTVQIDSDIAIETTGSADITAGGGVTIYPSVSVPIVTSATDLALSADDDITIMAVDDISISAGGVTSIVGIASALRINLTAGAISAPTSGSINVTAGNGPITLDASEDISLTAGDDVVLISTDDIGITAGDSAAITATGSLLTIWGKGGVTQSLPNPSATTSTLIRANKRIELTPYLDTYTSKPLRAPGLAGIAVSTKVGTDPILEGQEEKIFSGETGLPNYSNAARFTRHAVGSELRLEILVVGTAGSGADLPSLGLIKNSATSSELIFKVQAPVQPLEPYFKFKASAKIVNLTSTKIIIQHDCVGRADLGAGPAEETSTDCIIVDYTDPLDVTNPVWFEVVLYEAIDEYSVSLTSTLYNSHAEDVL